MKALLHLTVVLAVGLLTHASWVTAADSSDQHDESVLLPNARQLTFAGRRTGEGYFSADGTRMVFQSEREEGNPFYQIYLMDLETGDTQRISPGVGKTTCAWIHPKADRVLFASTHDDPEAQIKQKKELEDRATGKQRRYAWDYDERFDIYAKDLDTGRMRNLTDALGYDAEGSYSPDGNLIAFASNRHAYSTPLSDKEQGIFEHDKSYMMDIYIMNADGSNVRRLTDAPGYDGGPFFSADGSRICWRRFSEDGATAEIYTMNVDGSEQRQITRMGAMSWAPYFHPSGDYLIFMTNKHGFTNFELYLVDAAGEREPVRVTYTDGFDGLAAFSPDGGQLAWTSNRTSDKQSQIFIADWNDAEARRLLGLNDRAHAANTDTRVADAWASVVATSTTAAITTKDLQYHINVLASDQMQGRLTGTEGEALATAYVANVMKSLGLKPLNGAAYFDEFEFTAGVSLGPMNRLDARKSDMLFDHEPDKDWLPLSFSKTGRFDAMPIVFAGYGIVAPKVDEFDEYDSYVHLDVAGKWVMVLRYMPEGISAEHRQAISRYASLRYKAMVARDRGAAGLIVVSGPNSKVRQELVTLAFDASLAGTSIPAISVTDKVADDWLKLAGKDLKSLQDKLDTGELVMGFALDGIELSASIDIQQEKRTGRNVIGRLQAGDRPSEQLVVIGAHVDHLGRDTHSGSLARDDEKGQIHYGADDNASGVAAMLEIAQYLADMKQRGRLPLRRDVVFAAWSGEELGLLGSSHFVREFAGDESSDLHGKVAAYLNMDMVGRLRDKLTLQGTGTSGVWLRLIEQVNVPVGLSINTQNDAYLPTDSTAFYVRGVPILSAFTGAHEDYHTPRDTADKINFDGTQKIARLMGLLTRSIAIADESPDYVAQKKPEQGERRGGLRAYLGTIPDYAQGDIKGVKLSGVGKDGPADKAGLNGGDVIVELAGKKIENIYDYTYAIEALKIGQETSITVQRGDQTLKLKITPLSRD